MEIYKKISLTPTCRKETIERQESIKKNIIKGESSLLNNFIKQEGFILQQEDENQEKKQKEPVENEEENSIDNTLNNDENINENELKQSNQYIFSNNSLQQINNVTPNKTDVKNLKALAFGRNGELSSLLTYIYQYYNIKDESETIKNALKQIAQNDMEIYETLNYLIVAFGGGGTITDGQGNVWTGRNVITQTNPKKLILDDIALIQNQIKNYISAGKETSNLSLSEMFLNIIKSKQNNITLLQNLYDSL